MWVGTGSCVLPLFHPEYVSIVIPGWYSNYGLNATGRQGIMPPE